jgi:hypothetical protein
MTAVFQGLIRQLVSAALQASCSLAAYLWMWVWHAYCVIEERMYIERENVGNQDRENGVAPEQSADETNRQGNPGHEVERERSNYGTAQEHIAASAINSIQIFKNK